MPKFEYTNNFTRAAVSFPAHKFPHTSSVYYQCNVRLCINNGGCNQVECNGTNLQNNNNGGPRKKRFVGHHIEHKTMVNGMPKITDSPNNFNQSTQVTSSHSTSSTQNEPMMNHPSLPMPGALSSSVKPLSTKLVSDGAKQQQSDPNDMSFDVYSGLYVSDIDVGGK